MTSQRITWMAVGLALGGGLSNADCLVTAQPSLADTAAPGYMIVMGRDYAREDLAPYFAALPPIYEKYGGRYLALTAKVEELEGSYPYQSIIMSQWASVADAQAFWTSPEYAEARKLREGIGAFDVIAFEGLAPAPAE